MNKDIITIMCRGEPLYLLKSELEELSNAEWFLSLLLKYTKNETETKIEVGEYKPLVLSIIESLRYKKIILLKDISLDLFEALCDKWCCPEWLLESIQKQKKIPINEPIFKCVNCFIGFKMSENTNESCKIHQKEYNSLSDVFPCCGVRLRTPSDIPLQFCQSGYHVPNNNLNK